MQLSIMQNKILTFIAAIVLPVFIKAYHAVSSWFFNVVAIYRAENYGYSALGKSIN